MNLMNLESFNSMPEIVECGRGKSDQNVNNHVNLGYYLGNDDYPD